MESRDSAPVKGLHSCDDRGRAGATQRATTDAAKRPDKPWHLPGSAKTAPCCVRRLPRAAGAPLPGDRRAAFQRPRVVQAGRRLRDSRHRPRARTSASARERPRKTPLPINRINSGRNVWRSRMNTPLPCPKLSSLKTILSASPAGRYAKPHRRILGCFQPSRTSRSQSIRCGFAPVPPDTASPLS